MIYKAFISYSHEADDVVAPALQTALATFGKPWYLLRSIRVFRDKSNLAANPALKQSIENALTESEYLVLLASPQAAQSRWVHLEVCWWLKNRPLSNFIIAITGGELEWDQNQGDFDWELTTALPACLKGYFNDEPLYVDLRWARTADTLSSRHARFRSAVLEIAAPLLGKDKDELDGEDVRQHRRNKRVAWTAVASLLVLTIVAVISSLAASQAKRLAVSRQLAAQSELVRNQHPEELPLAALLAIESLRRTPSMEAERTLRLATALLPKLVMEVKTGAGAGDRFVYSSDGRYLAISSGIESITRVIDVATGRQLSRMIGGRRHQGETLSFSPDGSVIAVATVGEVRVWQTETGSNIVTIPFADDVEAISLSHGARYVAVMCGKGTSVWDLSTRLQVRHLAPQNGRNAVLFSGNGRYAVIDDTDYKPDKVLRVKNVDSGREVSTLHHGKAVQAVSSSPDGRYFVMQENDDAGVGRLRVRECLTGRELATFTYQGQVGPVVFSSDSRYLAAASLPEVWVGRGGPGKLPDQTAWVWELTTGKEISRVMHRSNINGIALSRNGKYLATASDDATARVWELASGREVARMTHEGAVMAVAFNSDGSRLETASVDGTAKVWETTAHKDLVHDFTAMGGIHSIAFSPDGRYLATAGGDATASVWNADGGTLHLKLSHDSGGINAIAFSTDGKMVATGGGDATARIWEVATGREVARLQHESEVAALAFSPDSARLATASFDKTARVWDVSSRRELYRKRMKSTLGVIRYSGDGRYLAAATGRTHPQGAMGPLEGENVAVVWDARSGNEIATLTHGYMGEPWESWKSRIIDIAFSPDSRYLATSSEDTTARVWDVVEGGEVVRMRHDAPVTSVLFSRDGRYLGTADGSARIWRALTGKQLARLTDDPPIRAVVFSGDSRYLAGDDAVVWEVPTGREIARIPHDSPVSTVAFSPNQEVLVTASESTVRTSHWRKEALIDEACSRVNRHLTTQEWHRFLPGEGYYPSCRKRKTRDRDVETRY